MKDAGRADDTTTDWQVKVFWSSRELEGDTPPNRCPTSGSLDVGGRQGHDKGVVTFHEARRQPHPGPAGRRVLPPGPVREDRQHLARPGPPGPARPQALRPLHHPQGRGGGRLARRDPRRRGRQEPRGGRAGEEEEARAAGRGRRGSRRKARTRRTRRRTRASPKRTSTEEYDPEEADDEQREEPEYEDEAEAEADHEADEEEATYEPEPEETKRKPSPRSEGGSRR